MTIQEFLDLTQEKREELFYLDLQTDSDGLGDMDSEQLSSFCVALKQCLQLKSLNLSNNCLNQFEASQWNSLGDALSSCKNLESLDLSDNHLRSSVMVDQEAINGFLKRFPTLKIIGVEDPQPSIYERFNDAIFAIRWRMHTWFNPIRSEKEEFNHIKNTLTKNLEKGEQRFSWGSWLTTDYAIAQKKKTALSDLKSQIQSIEYDGKELDSTSSLSNAITQWKDKSSTYTENGEALTNAALLSKSRGPGMFHKQTTRAMELIEVKGYSVS